MDRCIWHIGSPYDCEDSLFLSYMKHRSHGTVMMSTSVQKGNGALLGVLVHVACTAPSEDHHYFQHGNRALLEIQCSRWKPSPCSCCCNSQAPAWLETTSGRPNHTWLRTIESDLRWLNVGPSYMRKNALKNAGIQLWTRLCCEEYAVKREHFCQRKLPVASLKHLISLSGGRELLFIYHFFSVCCTKKNKKLNQLQ